MAYYENETTFISNSPQGIIIYSNDLFKLDVVSEKYKTNNSSTTFISNIIEEKIHQRFKGIDIYMLSDTYISKQNMDIYMNVNSDILDDELYVEILDKNNNKIKIDDYIKIKEDLLLFEVKMLNPGFYTIAGYLNDNNNKRKSNEISITVNNHNIEKNNIYIDEKYLSSIATTNNGLYTKYDNVDNFLSLINIPNSYSIDKSIYNILSYKFILIILIFLLLIEWYIRNKIGLV